MEESKNIEEKDNWEVKSDTGDKVEGGGKEMTKLDTLRLMSNLLNTPSQTAKRSQRLIN